MIQEIAPGRFSPAYREKVPSPEDRAVVRGTDNGGRFLIRREGAFCRLPTVGEAMELLPVPEDGGLSRPRYLFSTGLDEYFLLETTEFPVDKKLWSWEDSGFFRQRRMEKAMDFAGITAFHLSNWYRSRRFCGACGAPTEHSREERMVFCPKCGQVYYPVIAPVVMMAVTDGDRLLMSKYKGREQGNYVLLAGFMEIGETPEEAVRREIFEEAGIRVRNIRYYRSQPWGYSGSLLLGFFMDLDGDDTLTVQTSELAAAAWIPRSEIVCSPDDFSLTNEMICRFKNGEV